MMGLGGLAGSILPQVPVPDLAPRFTRDKARKPEIKEITRAPARDASPKPGNGSDEEGSEDGSERLSDIPSDLDDVPSDLDSSDVEAPKNTNTKVIEFTDAAPKKRGRPGKKAEAKNVIVI